MTVEDVLALKSVGQVTISPDGRWVAFVVTERDFDENRGETDLWVAPTDPSRGAARRLTFRVGADNAPRWHPDGTWLAFGSDRGEKRQLYGIRPDGGEAWPVTDFETSIGQYRFSPDGSQIAFTTSPEPTEADEELEKLRGRPIVWDSAYTDQWSRLWAAPLEDDRMGEATQRSPDTLYVNGFVWGPDSEALAFGVRPSPVLRTYRFGDVHVQDDADSPPRRVTAMPGGENPVAWEDGVGLVVSGSGHELGTYNGQLWLVDPAGGAGDESAIGEPVSLTSGLDENAGFVLLTANELLVQATYRTGRRLYRIPLSGGASTGSPVVAGEPEVITDDALFYGGFSATKDGSHVAFTAEDAASPPDVYVTSTTGFGIQRLTDLHPEVRDFELGAQRVVSWPSGADGEEIEGILTLPVGYREGERVPLTLVIHGGPSGVSSDRFSATRGAYPIQVYAGLGIATLQPNYRGSTGYGERFRSLNRGDISGRDWIDVDSGVDAMIERGIADPERLAVSGWSFGGHHTYWGITQTDRFAAASAGAGANDLISMYSQTDLPEFYQTYLGPKPWEDFDLYEERSAYRYVERVTTPLLIQVGERDERVPAEQSIQFYEAMNAIGKAPVKLVLYPGQPHGVRAPRLVRDLMSRNVEWLQKWLLQKEELVP
jgi:dipeptidyl aminopeptidase/acylaminoacyl peptidase